MSRKFTLAVIQMNSTDNFDTNKLFIEAKIKEASDKGALLVILPEHADGIKTRETENAFPVPGPVSSFYASLAQKYHIFLHCGTLTERIENGNPRNTSLVFSPDGKMIASYSKLHMFDVSVENGPSSLESRYITPGDHIAMVRTPLCTLGLSICYDIRFPEIYRLMSINGAELIIVSANFTYATGKAHWEMLLRARAIENGCYIAACNQCGTNTLSPAWGHSMVIDPWGQVTASLDSEPGLLIAEFDPELVIKAKKQIPVLNNLRKDIYKLESDKILFF